MQEERNDVAEPSQVSGPGEGDPPSAFLSGSKLRNKLEKLARWRIDPSLIQFPEDAREFRGGFAIVSQAFLAPSSSIAGTKNESEQTTAAPLASDAPNTHSNGDTQDPEDDHQAKDEGTETADTDIDRDREDGKKQHDDEQHEPHLQFSLLKVSDVPSSSEHIPDEGLGQGDHNPQSRNNAQEPEDNEQGPKEGVDGRENSNEKQNSDRPTPRMKAVAVKKLKIERDTDLERLLGLALRESEFLVELSHPNIAKLEGFVEELSERKVWLIFPWEEHGNLRDFLTTGEWEIPERISLINDVTLGLEHLHSQEPPIYHGDLKSLNILVNSNYRALITDFGSARHLGNDLARKQPKESKEKPEPATYLIGGEEQVTLKALFSATASTLTLTGSSYTIRWAAPELLQDEKPCLGSDIWALGWIAYEVMTNTIPFHDVKKDAIVINRVIQGHLPSVTEDARMSLIRALCSLMVQCWSIAPEKRPTAEGCRKLISWMPMIVPAPIQSTDEEASQLRHAGLQGRLGQMYRRQADYPSALRCYAEALDIYTTRKDSIGRAAMLYNLGDVHRFRLERTKAIEFYSEALQIYSDVGDEIGKANTIYGLADAHRGQNEFSEAVKLYSEHLRISTETGRARERGLALWGLADVHQSREEYSEAINLYSEALPIFTDVGDQANGAVTLCGLAQVHQAQLEYDEAIRLYSEAKQIFTNIGDKHWLAEALWNLASIHQRQDRQSEAMSFYTKAAEVYEEIGAPQSASNALEEAAKIRRRIEGAPEAFDGTADGEKESLLTPEET